MRPVLIIETSGKSLGVALRAESGLLFEQNVSAGAIHGKALGPLVQKALDDNGLKAAELEAVAVSLGPGSWTGLRIGLSFSKTLAWAAGVKLLGVPSFEGLACAARRELARSAAVLCLRDARSEGFFAALFAETSDGTERWIEECVLHPTEAFAAAEKALSEHPGATMALCGDRVCMDAVASHAKGKGWEVIAGCEHIPASALAEAAWARLKRGEGVAAAAEIHRVGPLYLRASDPELKLSRKQVPGAEAR